jgi:hypothetical protein
MHGARIGAMYKAVAVLLCLLAAACNRFGQESAAPAKPHVKTVIIPENEAQKHALDAVHIPPLLIEKVLLGTQLGPDGAVSADSTSVAEGQPLYVTVRLRDSPIGLHIGAIVKDAHGKNIAREEKPMNGAKVTTFAIVHTLPPGSYSAEAYWGAPPGIIKNFEVTGKKQRRQ